VTGPSPAGGGRATGRRLAWLVSGLVVAAALLVASIAAAAVWARDGSWSGLSTPDGSGNGQPATGGVGVPDWMDRMHDAMHGDRSWSGDQQAPATPSPSPSSTGANF
jgi:hypothetical protein